MFSPDGQEVPYLFEFPDSPPIGRVEKIDIPFKKTGTTDFGERFELNSPRRNTYTHAVFVYVSNIADVDLDNVRCTTLYLPTAKESSLDSHMTAFATLVAPGKGQTPFLAVSVGVGGDDYRSVLYLKSRDGSPLHILRMEARAMPLSPKN